MFRYPWKDAFPFGLSADSEPLSTFTILMDINEKLYGLGERFVGFNRRGQNIEFYHQDAAGDTSIRSYKNIPFYMSSAGYGVFINSSALMDFDLGMHLNDYACIFTADHIVDVTLFAGPDFKDILRAYSDVTGHTPYLPRWSYGLWMSRNSYESRQVVEEVAARIRKERIPCDVIHLDTIILIPFCLKFYVFICAFPSYCYAACWRGHNTPCPVNAPPAVRHMPCSRENRRTDCSRQRFR